jgi:hypothetical protein
MVVNIHKWYDIEISNRGEGGIAIRKIHMLCVKNKDGGRWRETRQLDGFFQLVFVLLLLQKCSLSCKKERLAIEFLFGEIN